MGRYLTLAPGQAANPGLTEEVVEKGKCLVAIIGRVVLFFSLSGSLPSSPAMAN